MNPPSGNLLGAKPFQEQSELCIFKKKEEFTWHVASIGLDDIRTTCCRPRTDGTGLRKDRCPRCISWGLVAA